MCLHLEKCSLGVAVKVLKGWTNGWATSKRYSNNDDKILPCIFGCHNYTDDLAHYLQCPHLYAIWKFMLNPDDLPEPPNPHVSEFPLQRWGLVEPCVDKFKSIACVFSGYHAVRREFKAQKDFLVTIKPSWLATNSKLPGVFSPKPSW